MRSHILHKLIFGAAKKKNFNSRLKETEMNVWLVKGGGRSVFSPGSTNAAPEEDVIISD